MSQATLYNVDFLGANLHQANLQAAYLREVQFAGADLTMGANFSRLTAKPYVYLDGARVNHFITLWPDGFDLSPFDLVTVVALKQSPIGLTMCCL